MIRLKRIEEKDVTFVHGIEDKCFNSIKRDDFIEHYVQNPLYEIELIEYNEVIIGYLVIWLDLDKSQLYSIYIRPDNRKQGMAFQALKLLEKKLLEQGIREWTLEVRISNHSAINLYEKMGFQAIHIRKGYYANHEDALYMYKELRK
ncbi:MAG TPA: ribosomal protein S18-alanine N-acetyltransferase [Candidatus Izemoplasmatales bacterium]|nr:ribosomal protein S18-alanine N-acetyltransferase [Candidatus Izemoplasmatales bacterium]